MKYKNLNESTIRKLIRRQLLEAISNEDVYKAIKDGPSGKFTPIDKAGEVGKNIGDAVGKVDSATIDVASRSASASTGAPAPATVEKKKCVDEEATKKQKEDLAKSRKMWADGFDIIPESEAIEIAIEIYEATKGGWDFGMGTDETGISDAIKKCPTLMDLSLVSHVFEQKYAGAWTFTPDLLTVFETELDQGDMYQYVTVPIKELPFISIGGKPYTKKEFVKLGDAGKEVAELQPNLGSKKGFRDYLGDAAAGAAIMSVLPVSMTLMPALALGALTFGVYMMFDDGKIDPTVAGSLNSKNYRNMKDFFERQEALFDETNEADVEVLVDCPEEVDPDPGTPKKSIYPILPANINGPAAGKKECVKRIQAVMNQYSVTRNLGLAAIGVDGTWGPITQGMWNQFCPHVFDTHEILSKEPVAASVISGNYQWQFISMNLVSKYPGYVNTECGALNFTLDAYYGNIVYGHQVVVQQGGGGMFAGTPKGRSSGRKQPQRGQDASVIPVAAPTSRQAARTDKLTWKDVMIGARSQVPAYADVDYLSDINKRAADKIAMSLVRQMKTNRFWSQRPGFFVETEAVYNISFKVKNSGEIKVKKFSGPAMDKGRFEKPEKTIEQVVNATMTTDRDKNFLRDGVISITFPAGTYTSMVNEAAVRKLVKKEILNKLLK